MACREYTLENKEQLEHLLGELNLELIKGVGVITLKDRVHRDEGLNIAHFFTETNSLRVEEDMPLPRNESVFGEVYQNVGIINGTRWQIRQILDRQKIPYQKVEWDYPGLVY